MVINYQKVINYKKLEKVITVFGKCLKSSNLLYFSSLLHFIFYIIMQVLSSPTLILCIFLCFCKVFFLLNWFHLILRHLNG